MKTSPIGFIGGGRITKIFLTAFSNKSRDFEKIIVYDTNAEVLEQLKGQFQNIETGTLKMAASLPTVVLALHPPHIISTLEAISEIVSEDTQVISLAPKITIEQIASKLDTKKIARMIPNATSYINEGFNPVTFSAGFPAGEKYDLLGLFSNLGHTFEVNEQLLEPYAIISAMLPTYFWFQWQEILEIGSQIGLTPHESSEALVKTLESSINLMFKSGLNRTEVMDLIPVRPLEENEGEIKAIYRKKLLGLYEKIKP